MLDQGPYSLGIWNLSLFNDFLKDLQDFAELDIRPYFGNMQL